MFYLRVCLMAMHSLWIHPLRASLATLGVIIGVGAVVAAMAILKGMSARFESGFASMGSNRMYVSPALQRRNQRVVGAFDSLKFEDAAAMSNECPAVRIAMPQMSYPGALVKFLSKTTEADVVGVTSLYCTVNDHQVTEGEFIKRSDVQGSRYVAVLGSTVRRELFGGRPALDEKIKISGLLGSRTFIVIGVMEEKGAVAFQDVDKQILIPVTTAMQKLFGSRSIHAIVVEAASARDEDLEAAKSQIKKLLRRRHKIRAGQQDDFEVRTQKELVAQVASFQAIVGVVLWSIAGISLVVGGIGIMNIMLVAVTERTREIGVRMAMGAKRGDVLLQFLVEASIVSFLGGALGMLMGWGLATLIERITRVMETVVTGWSVSMALAMATTVGLLSGIYPAWKASRLDPVEAIRYE